MWTLLIFWSDIAQASCLNCWFGPTGEGEAWVAPFFVLDPSSSGFAEVLLYGSFGFRNADLTVGYGAGTSWIEPKGPYQAPLDVVPRYWFTPSLGLAAHLQYVPGETSLIVGPELHGSVEGDRGFFYGNLAWAPRLGVDGVDSGDWWADASPGINLGERVQLFLELYAEGTPADGYVWGTANPGVSVAFDPDWVDSVALGVIVPLVPEPSTPGLGGWYSHSFSLGPRDRARGARARPLPGRASR